MTVPSADAFLDCIRQLRDVPVPELYCEFRIERFAQENDDEGRALVRRAYADIYERRVRACDHGTVKWLWNDPAFQSAWKRIRGRRPPVEPTWYAHEDEAFLNRKFAQLKEAALSGDRAQFFSHVRVVLYDHFAAWDWLIGLTEALHEYLYLDAAKIAATNRKCITERLAAAIKGIEALAQLADDPFASALYESVTRGTGHHARLSEMAGTLSGLKEMTLIDPENLYPIARLDDTVKERLFVWRIAQLNRRRWRVPKTALIADLMAIEGFATQPDERTVERQCAAFDDQLTRYYRQFDTTAAGKRIAVDAALWRKQHPGQIEAYLAARKLKPRRTTAGAKNATVEASTVGTETAQNEESTTVIK
ncbi:hypothetical protein [Paraburkholderia sp. 35.1]|uniref:hypothetical protein n=1 Tax=Paraburkholderia sp. 35.1 TaxID=2991058 RepID=UPI003D1F5D2A